MINLFNRMTMVRELFILITAFFIFFLLTIVYVRLDFAITKDEHGEVKMKVAGVCEKVLGNKWCYFKLRNSLIHDLMSYNRLSGQEERLLHRLRGRREQVQGVQGRRLLPELFEEDPERPEERHQRHL